MKTIVIVDYGAGNVFSVRLAFERLGMEVVLSDVPSEIESAERVVFPGVGAAPQAMKRLKEKGLDTVISKLQQPVLGICLGMQLLCASSQEGNTKALNCVGGEIVKMHSNGIQSIKVPHVGWNSLSNLSGKLFEGIPEGAFAYFVHSYCLSSHQNTTAISTHGTPFSAALEWENFYACQFHPEKSGAVGQRILQNFCAIN